MFFNKFLNLNLFQINCLVIPLLQLIITLSQV